MTLKASCYGTGTGGSLAAPHSPERREPTSASSTCLHREPRNSPDAPEENFLPSDPSPYHLTPRGHRTGWSGRLPVAVFVGIAFLAAVARPAGAEPSITVPPALPPRFGFGLAAHPDASGLDGWVPESGVPWDYVYQYLAGGVNTGNGWQAWNSASQFPLFYARRANELGAIPVFPYYQLLQSNGPCDGCGEAQRDLANLNDPSVMASYYADFAVLMQRLGPGTHDGIQGFGGTAIVQIDPDLSGYANQAVLEPSQCSGYCTGQGNDPTFLRASVASSGMAEVADYPDTYQGFNWALLHLRDLYAPNVLLAVHVSNWATLQDIGSSTDPALDADALGSVAGTFAALSGSSTAPPGTSTYDLVFNDVADRDAGYMHDVLGRSTAWWDRLNVALPNFDRWERYLAAVTRAAGRPAVVWQVPLGNQVFRSVDNTAGHYQDNRAEYFFDHVAELTSAGAVAVLFGRGNGGSTTNTDDTGDGVTNPPVRCTSDGLSSGEVCNSLESTVPDDDGGYLRQAAGRYYTNGPLPLVREPAVAATKPIQR